MPIRLNLLAEAQAQEDLRRRDPVKRAAAVGVLLVLAMVVWSLSLWFKGMMYRNDVNALENLVKTHQQEHTEVMTDQKRLAEVDQRLAALNKLSASRFLVGNLLDALQRATLEDVQLARLRLDQTFIFLEEVKANPDNPKRVARPPSVTQKTIVTLDVRDSSATPGDLVPKFQQVLADAPYFVTMLDKSDPQRVRLKEGSYGPIQVGSGGKPYRPFALECHFPEKTR